MDIGPSKHMDVSIYEFIRKLVHVLGKTFIVT